MSKKRPSHFSFSSLVNFLLGLKLFCSKKCLGIGKNFLLIQCSSPYFFFTYPALFFFRVYVGKFCLVFDKNGYMHMHRSEDFSCVERFAQISRKASVFINIRYGDKQVKGPYTDLKKYIEVYTNEKKDKIVSRP